GRFIVRHPKAILAAVVLFVVVSFGVAGGVADRLTSGGFYDPNSESERAASLLQQQFGTQDPNIVLLVTAKRGTVDRTAVARAGRALTDELAAQDDVSQVASYWSLGNAPPLKSNDGRQALVLAAIPGSDDHVNDVIKVVSPRFTHDNATVRVAVG